MRNTKKPCALTKTDWKGHIGEGETERLIGIPGLYLGPFVNGEGSVVAMWDTGGDEYVWGPVRIEASRTLHGRDIFKVSFGQKGLKNVSINFNSYLRAKNNLYIR
jgi:hypothetical protein